MSFFWETLYISYTPSWFGGNHDRRAIWSGCRGRGAAADQLFEGGLGAYPLGRSLAAVHHLLVAVEAADLGEVLAALVAPERLLPGVGPGSGQHCR